jgi:hypothetical protein
LDPNHKNDDDDNDDELTKYLNSLDKNGLRDELDKVKKLKK